MVGAGIFSLPQNMSAIASVNTILIVWGITGIGILLFACYFLHLSHLKPQLEGGIYSYARAEFGDLTGGLSAWGY